MINKPYCEKVSTFVFYIDSTISLNFKPQAIFCGCVRHGLYSTFFSLEQLPLQGSSGVTFTILFLKYAESWCLLLCSYVCLL